MKPDEMLDAGPEVIGVIESLVATVQLVAVVGTCRNA